MVSADAARTAVGVAGNVIALILFLSPVPTFYKIWKKRSVEQFSPVPYLAFLLNCMMWVLYGLPVVHPHSPLVLTINGAGMAIQLTYIAIFLLYSAPSQRLRVFAILLAEFAFVAATGALVILLAHTTERRTTIIGILCVIFGTLMYAAPLSVMKMVIQSKSVEFMPPFLSIASFLNGVCWTAYALIKFDLYITIPNGLGVLLAAAQLLLYGIYYKNTQRLLEARKRKETTVGMTEVVVAPAVDDGKVATGGSNRVGSSAA